MNEIVLSNNLDQIELEINHHKQIAGQSIWEIGRRLNHVKENDLAHGEFTNWVEGKLNISIRQARKFMKVTNELPKGKSTSLLGIEALYLISSIPEEEREKEHETSQGETKKVDAMTVKELQQLKKEIKQRDHQIEELKNKKPEVIEKEVIKEVKVEPHDYPGLKSDNQQLSGALKRARAEADAAKKRTDFIEKSYQEVLEDRKEDLTRKEQLEAYRQELRKLANKKDKLSDDIDTIKELSNLNYEVNNLLEKIAPYYFNHNINAIRNNAVLEQSFMETINSIQKWCDEMYNLLGKQNTFEGEIIND